MSTNYTLGITISLKDAMSKQADRAMAAMTQAAVKASAGMIKSNDKVMSSQQRLFQDRERLGIRSEQRIQREIKVTEAAYHRLMQSGSLSWREQERATEAMRRKVQQLNNEMGKVSMHQRAISAGRFVAGAAAGGVAAGMVIKPVVDKAMAYDLRLANMANTAYAGKPLADRRSGMRYLDQSIIGAVRAGGGTRDMAAETLDAIIASGAMSTDDAGKLLPTLMRSATASNSSASDLASIAIRGMQTFKLNASDVPDIIGMAIAAGQKGGFEIKDMAKWLPQQMAAASQSGLSGREGFAKLVALNQAAAITAGNKDEAGNNLVNLLAKINSSDTAQDAKKIGINLPKYLAQQRAKGIDSVTAFSNLAESQVSKSSAWKQIQQQLASAKDDSSRQEALNSMASIVQGSAVGKLVQDRQALMALIGVMGNKSLVSDTASYSKMAASTVAQDNFSLISETASFRTGQAGNEKEIAQQRAMDNLTPSIGALSDKVVEAARTYPGLTTATVAATTALTALAAAGGAASVTSVLTGGGKKGVGTAVKAALGTGARGFSKLVPQLALLGGALEGGMMAGGGLVSLTNWSASKFTGKENQLGEWLLAMTSKGEGVKLNGNITVKVDQNGKVIGAEFNSNQPALKSNVYTGQYMGVPG